MADDDDIDDDVDHVDDGDDDDGGWKRGPTTITYFLSNFLLIQVDCVNNPSTDPSRLEIRRRLGY